MGRAPVLCSASDQLGLGLREVRHVRVGSMLLKKEFEIYRGSMIPSRRSFQVTTSEQPLLFGQSFFKDAFSPCKICWNTCVDRIIKRFFRYTPMRTRLCALR